MNAANQFDWVDFYKELADTLLVYKDNRQGLIDKIRKIYEITELNLPSLELDNQIDDIDPFTVFGLFNKNLKRDNRVRITQAIAQLFKITKPTPTSFASLPVLDSRTATFYHFKGKREANDIDDLWTLFESALVFAAKPTKSNRDKLENAFDLNIQKKGIGLAKITIGLYWIAPDSFLSLDRTNKAYVYNSGKFPVELVKTLPTIKENKKILFSTYFGIVEKLSEYLKSAKSNIKDFKELSLAAWLYANPGGGDGVDMGVKRIRYWTYSPGEGAAVWDECYDNGIIAIGWEEIGDLSQYRSKNDMKEAMQEKIDRSRTFRNDAHATWQFANEMEPGDVVFAKKGKSLIIGRGIVESDYYFDRNRKMYNSVRNVKWTHKGSWKIPDVSHALKTLTDVTPYTNYVEQLKSLFEEVNPAKIEYPPYHDANFLEEVFMDENDYETLTVLLQTKKNVILQGAPGVGKTFAAKRLAYSIMGLKDVSRVMMVQFHQSYSYEDFIVGFRPSENGFELKYGAFYKFCKEAEIDSENEYFLIIDEINRGNLSKIFGELFMLIENDKRGQELQLLYSDEKFSVPKNVYIIGMMNTADRSLAMLDYALRRRFAFFEMKPGFDSKGFQEYQSDLENNKFDRLINCVKGLNEAIAADESLGGGFCIGHSYFCNLEEASDQALSAIVEFELIPLLREYWFDEPTKVRNWTDSLRNAIK